MNDQALSMADILAAIHELTDDDHIEARREAAEMVVKAEGDEPQFDQFVRRASEGGIPRGLTLGVGLILGTALIAAFSLSIFRVFTAGRDLFLLHMPGEHIQAAIAGVATFALAEMLVVGSLFVANVWMRSGWKRIAMYASACLGALMAITANIVVSSPTTFWGWLDTLAPPVAVMLISLAAEALLLETIRQRQAAYQKYSNAWNEWKQAISDPEASEKFRTVYLPRALKRRLQQRNATGPGATRRKEIMSQLRPQHWRILVLREMQSAQGMEHDAGDLAALNGHGDDSRPLSLPAERTTVTAAAN